MIWMTKTIVIAAKGLSPFSLMMAVAVRKLSDDDDDNDGEDLKNSDTFFMDNTSQV